MNFDKILIFDLTAGVYVYFYNISTNVIIIMFTPSDLRPTLHRDYNDATLKRGTWDVFLLSCSLSPGSFVNNTIIMLSPSAS